MVIGNVDLPGATTKRLVPKLDKDKIKPTANPEIREGLIKGISILQNTFLRPAPILPAFSKSSSTRIIPAKTTLITKGLYAVIMANMSSKEVPYMASNNGRFHKDTNPMPNTIEGAAKGT